MGPLIPNEIINSDLNFFFALIIGIAFGFILEQAGFSSSRKLAGVFYGYDFVVLKVFFTAGVTAATGLFFLKYLGWVDFEMLYINPFYLWSSIIGGVVMGFGFILGGFCPGTSLPAAVIGKIDAWFFILGMFIGVFIFTTFYPVFEPLHKGNFLGNLLVHESLGISQKWFLFFLVLMALSAFAITQLIEDNSSKFKELLNFQKLSLRYPLAFILILAITALFLPEKRNSYFAETPKNEMASEIANDLRFISTDKVVHSTMNDVNDLLLVDVRTAQEYKTYHLPNAINIPVGNILNEANLKNIIQKNKKTVFYANSSTQADMAWFFAKRHGLNNIYVMNGGLNKMFNDIFKERHEIPNNPSIDEISREKFLKKAHDFFKEGHLNTQKTTKTIPVPEVPSHKSVKGGC